MLGHDLHDTGVKGMMLKDMRVGEKSNDLIYAPALKGKRGSGRRVGEARRRAMPGVLRRQPANRSLVSQCTHHHAVVFLLTFFSYSLLHASRKTFSNVKVSISSQWTPFCPNDTALNLQPYELWNSSHLFPKPEDAILFLGTLDTIFLFSYAVGLFVSGIVGDRLNMRWVLSFGMCSSALVVFVFGTVTEWLHFYNKWFYCCLWIVNGLLQSTGWPCVVAVMGNWFGKAGRGLVFGLWSACASVGNILGAFLASSVLQYGYEYAFLVTALVQFAGGVIVFFGLVISPKEVGLSEVGEEDSGAAEEDASEPLIGSNDNEDDDQNYSIQAADLSSSSSNPPQPRAIGFFQACCLPGVILYSLAYACLKLVNYSFFFWLPFYLSNNFGWKEAEADKLSIWYDVGGIVGGTIQGYISDMLQKRAPVLAVSLILAIASLLGYSRTFVVGEGINRISFSTQQQKKKGRGVAATIMKGPCTSEFATTLLVEVRQTTSRSMRFSWQPQVFSLEALPI
ncbi:sugar phosphate exchanger 3 isoform X2 [Rhineura floridana]|uniref:sugar phosphate exchanger 3 isoform X2 n=1 Tax=Rhineura floridana TaxID=261503 RepID=UPI002AC867C0|nr:sugar phosphate exchanger 3 isoform X2 [Rhineura floridana]